MLADKLMRTTVLMALILTLAMFSGCGSRDHLVTASDNESEVRLHTGEALVTRLESNPTTGYSWQVLEIDNSVLEQDGDPDFKAASGKQGEVGAGGKKPSDSRPLHQARPRLL